MAVNLELPIKTVSALNAREHWAKKAKRNKMERSAVYMTLRSLKVREDLPLTARLIRYSCGELDSDNLLSAFKAIRDGIADAYGIKDNDSRIEWQYGQEKCPRGQFLVRIELEHREEVA